MHYTISALSHVTQVWRSFWCRYYTFFSPLSCYAGVKIFLMYVPYLCQPCLMLCRCEDLSDECTILFSAHVSCYVGVKIFLMYAQYYSQSCLMLCRCEDPSDLCTIPLSALSHAMQVWRPFWCMHYTISALSHVMQVWRSFWCRYYTFFSPLSCYAGVKIFLMYVPYLCQPCLMLCRCEDLSDVCTILLSAHVSCYVGVKTFLMYALYFCQPCLMLCRCEDLSDVGTILFSALSHVMQVWRSFRCMYHTFVRPVSCYVGVKIFLMYALYFCQPMFHAM